MISNDFIDKHRNNSEMLEVVNNVYNYMDTRNLTSLQHETICETLYGIQKLYAEPSGIPMEPIYMRFSKIEEFRYANVREMAGAGGNYCAMMQADDGHYYARINVSERHKGDINVEREILTHELVHAAVQPYTFSNNGDIIGWQQNGLKYTYVNEVCVQDMSMKILELHGYGLNSYTDKLSFKGNVAEDLHIDSQGYGYPHISPLAKPLFALYGKEISQEMLTHGNQLYDTLNRNQGSENILQSMNEKLEKIQSAPSNKLEEVNYYSGLYTDCERMLYHKIQSENMNLSEYLKLAQSFREHSYMVFVDDEPVLLADTVSQNCEIKYFYKHFAPDADLNKEINPMTRSRDCENFLLALGTLKDSGRLYTQEELQNFQWEEVRTKGNMRELFVQCGDDKFKTDGIKNKGIVAVSSFEDTEEVLKVSLLSSLAGKFKGVEPPHQFTLQEMRELSMLTGYGKHVLENTTNHDEVVLYSITDANMKGNFINSVRKSDLTNLKDTENNNIYHVLAASLNSNADNYYAIIGTFKHAETNQLLNEENVHGFTPIKEAFKNNNINFINALSHAGYTFEGQQGEHSNAKDSAAEYVLMSGKEPYLIKLINDYRFEEFERLVVSKVNINVYDENYETILHHLADKDKFKFLNQETLEIIKERTCTNNDYSSYGETALEKLTSKDFSVESFKYLINEVGVDPTITNALTNRTILHNVLQQKNELMNSLWHSPSEHHKFNECLDILLQKNIDINAVGKGYDDSYRLITPLQIACGINRDSNDIINYETVTKLIKAGAQIEYSTNGTDGPIFVPSPGYRSPLEYADKSDDIELKGAFIKAGVPIEAFDLENVTLGSRFYLENLANNFTVDLDLIPQVEKYLANKTEDLDLVRKTESLDLIGKTEDLDVMDEVAATKNNGIEFEL